MLPKKRRISRKEIESALKVSKRFNSSHLFLCVVEKGLSGSKFSFSVPKKVCKTAVERNKFRRRGYSVVGKVVNKVRPGFWCLFVFKKGSSAIKFETMENEILELLSVSGVLK